MLFSTASLILSISSLAIAAPLRVNKRQDVAADANLLVLKFADVLEQLESKFYAQALAQFKEADFKKAGFLSSQIPIELFQGIQRDESTHSSVLQSAIKAAGGVPIADCQFDFSSALTDVKTMAATARLVENVGVGAYLGAAPLITDPVLLVAAGSILTVEARHQSILNVLGGASAIPSSFDIALTPPEVLAIAGGFIAGCDVGIKANPALKITNTDTVKTGTLLKFSADALAGTTDGLFCQMMQGGFPFSITQPLASCVVPDGLSGPVAIWITSDAQPLLNNVRDRATTQLVAGPTMAFIDSKVETLGQLVRGAGGKSGLASTSTATISPAEASAIITKAASSSSSSAKATATSSVKGKGKASSTASSAAASKTASASSSSSSASKTGSASSSSSSASKTGSASSSSSAAKSTATGAPTDDGLLTDDSLDALLNDTTDDSTDPAGATPPTDASTPTDDSDILAGLDGTTPPADASTPTDDSDILAGLADPTDGTTPPADASTPTDDSDILAGLTDPTDGTTPPADASTPTDDSDILAGLTDPTDGTTPPTDGSDPTDDSDILAGLDDPTDGSDPLAGLTDGAADKSSASPSPSPSPSPSSSSSSSAPAASATGAPAAPAGAPTNDITQSIAFTKRMSRRSSTMFKREYD